MCLEGKEYLMDKQEVVRDTTQKILVCRAVEDENDKNVFCFRYCEGFSFCKKQYIYKFVLGGMKRETTIFQIVDIIKENEQVKENIHELEANEVLRPISYRCSWQMPEEVLTEVVNYTYTQLQKEIRNIFRELKLELYFAKLESIDKNRKKYLFDTFGVEDELEFKKRKSSNQMRWFKEFNIYDMDFQFTISLYELKPCLLNLIDQNMIICNADKVALKANCIDEIEHIIESTFLRENARYQMDSYIGVDFCDETKELVWAHMSPCEIKVEFSFFWTLVKSMLSLAYIPAVILMLQDKSTKIYMYIFLALVYLIAIIFSDEKQVTKLVKYRKPIDKEPIRYVNLYYCGLILSTTFILFTIQLVQRGIGGMKDILIHLFADILFAYVLILLFNLCISLVAWGITLFISIKNIRKKGDCVWKWTKKVIKTVFWLCSLGCSFVVLDIQKYFKEQAETNIGVEIWIFMCCILIAEINIITMWKKAETVREHEDIELR